MSSYSSIFALKPKSSSSSAKNSRILAMISGLSSSATVSSKARLCLYLTGNGRKLGLFIAGSSQFEFFQTLSTEFRIRVAVRAVLPPLKAEGKLAHPQPAIIFALRRKVQALVRWADDGDYRHHSAPFFRLISAPNTQASPSRIHLGCSRSRSIFRFSSVSFSAFSCSAFCALVCLTYQSGGDSGSTISPTKSSTSAYPATLP